MDLLSPHIIILKRNSNQYRLLKHKLHSAISPLKMSLFNPFSHSAVIFRKKTFFESGGYNYQYKYAQDYDLWVRMLNFGQARILKEELGMVRISEQSESNKNAKKTET
jgi:hypothetical protein